MAFITPVSLIIGMLLAAWLKPYGFLSTWLFAFMTFAGSLGSGFGDFAKVLRRPLPIVCALFLLHVALPLVAWGLGTAFFGGDAETVTGFVLAAAIPTGVTTLFWVTVKGGDAALALSIVLLDTLIAPIVVPGTLSLLQASEVHVDAAGMMLDLLWMIVLPSLLGMSVNHVTRGMAARTWKPRLSPLSKLAMGAVVALNGAVVAPFFARFELKLLGILLTIILMTVIAYALGWSVCRWFWKKETGLTVAMTYTVGMRNISAGAVIATAFLPAPAALPVILGMLVQQLMASIAGMLIGRAGQKKAAVNQKLTAAG